MSRGLLLITLLTFCHICCSQETSNWSLEFHTGVPLNIPLPLTIKQEGYADIKLSGNYYSEPLTPPIFWVLRLGKWKNGNAWECELKHQKLYLNNPPDEIEYFNVTHGYNQITINRVIKLNWTEKHPFLWRTGAGIVLAHPESTIRGIRFDSKQSFFNKGYYIAGPAINTSLSQHLKVSERFYIDIESKFVLCYADVPIANGNAIVWHSSFELIFGLGYIFIKK